MGARKGIKSHQVNFKNDLFRRIKRQVRYDPVARGNVTAWIIKACINELERDNGDKPTKTRAPQIVPKPLGRAKTPVATLKPEDAAAEPEQAPAAPRKAKGDPCYVCKQLVPKSGAYRSSGQTFCRACYEGLANESDADNELEFGPQFE